MVDYTPAPPITEPLPIDYDGDRPQRPRTKAEKEAELAARIEAERAKQSDADAAMILFMANNAVMGIVGPEAATDDREWDAIQKPLATVIAKSSAYGAIEKYSAPLALVIGCLMWSRKIIVVWQAKHPPRPKAPKAAPGAPPARANAAPETYPEPDEYSPSGSIPDPAEHAQLSEDVLAQWQQSASL